MYDFHDSFSKLDIEYLMMMKHNTIDISDALNLAVKHI
jgi:hypothetical protein